MDDYKGKFIGKKKIVSVMQTEDKTPGGFQIIFLWGILVFFYFVYYSTLV